VATSLVALAGGTAAHGAGRPTDYAFTSFAYGTKVKAAAGTVVDVGNARANIKES
jgi:hypothetical protein